jgi:hypothetical protein
MFRIFLLGGVWEDNWNTSEVHSGAFWTYRRLTGSYPKRAGGRSRPVNHLEWRQIRLSGLSIPVGTSRASQSRLGAGTAPSSRVGSTAISSHLLHLSSSEQSAAITRASNEARILSTFPGLIATEIRRFTP